VAGLEFEQPLEKETFEQYLSHLEDLIKRMEGRIAEVGAAEGSTRQRTLFPAL
jgi:hypothetical protein